MGGGGVDGRAGAARPLVPCPCPTVHLGMRRPAYQGGLLTPHWLAARELGAAGGGGCRKPGGCSQHFGTAAAPAAASPGVDARLGGWGGRPALSRGWGGVGGVGRWGGLHPCCRPQLLLHQQQNLLFLLPLLLPVSARLLRVYSPMPDGAGGGHTPTACMLLPAVLAPLSHAPTRPLHLLPPAALILLALPPPPPAPTAPPLHPRQEAAQARDHGAGLGLRV